MAFNRIISNKTFKVKGYYNQPQTKQSKRTNTLDNLFTDIEFRIHTIEARITDNDTKLQGKYYDVMLDSFWRFEIDITPTDLAVIKKLGRHDTKEFRTFIIYKGSHIRIKGDVTELKETPELKKALKVQSRDIKIDSIVES